MALKRISLLIIFTIMMGGLTMAKDWSDNCDRCHCKWSHSKKTADCTSKNYTKLPDKMVSELQVLDLSFNPITELRSREFEEIGLLSLHKLYMKNCTLQDIKRDALHGLAILIEINLSNNLLSTLQPGTFFNLSKLRKIILNNNEIQILEDNVFKDLIALKSIELRNNRIHLIEPRSFINIPLLSDLDLQNNRLTILSPDVFKDLRNLKSIAIENNPWNCSCELQEFRRYASSLNLYTKQTKCYYPEHLRDKRWDEVPSDEFACKPTILKSRNGNIVFASSENVTLQCRYRGIPQPDITWMFKGKPVIYDDVHLSKRQSLEPVRQQTFSIYTSELIITRIEPNDEGTYSCLAKNKDGRDETDITLTLSAFPIDRGVTIPGAGNQRNFLILIIGIICIGVILLACVLVIYTRRRKDRKLHKNSSMSENGLVSTKLDKSHGGDSMLEGSVIGEMQKSLLTEVNPVVKPPRRTDMQPSDIVDDGHDMKKTLLEETALGSHDEDTQSVALSDTTPRSRQTFVDDGYGTNLPPDLLAFSGRYTQTPSLQSSMVNIPDGRLYGKSPMTSPIYNTVYSGQMPGFRTLQHPKNGRSVAVAPRTNSPFTPAPIICTPVVMKQGYVTVPRRPRIPSWTPSLTPTLPDYPSASPTPSAQYNEPVYDNLGRRTTAGGNLTMNQNKTNGNPIKLNMKDRPLPATPESHQLVSMITPNDANESLYGKTNGNKVPPRPPPKPKKRTTQTAMDSSSLNSQNRLFQDEDEDGTEV